MASLFLYGGLTVVGPLIALILIMVRVQGMARVVGVIGSVLMLLGGLLQALASAFLPLLARRYHLTSSMASLIFLPLDLIAAVGIVLLGLSVGMGRTAPAPYPTPGAEPRRGPIIG